MRGLLRRYASVVKLQSSPASNGMLQVGVLPGVPINCQFAISNLIQLAMGNSMCFAGVAQ